METRKIPVGKGSVSGFVLPLLRKNLVILRGSKGYIMCGYLQLQAAEKFDEIAVRIVGVSTIEEALAASVESCSSAAQKLGIHPGQPVKEILPLIV